MRRFTNPKGCVYFIRIGEDGPIKVGFTKCAPLKRMFELQCGCPWELRLIGFIPGSKLNEQWLQDKFAPFKMLREWFSADIFPDVNEILSSSDPWPVAELSPVNRAIHMADGVLNLWRITGCDQPVISTARRNGKVPKRISQFLAQAESAA